MIRMLAPACPAAMSIGNFSAAANDRFANNPAFVGIAGDWSGVGRSNDGHWGTMLTPAAFLSATHYHPGTGSVMSFFPGNDPGVSAVTRTVIGGQRIGTSDLWIGYLAAPLPTTITHYDFSQVVLTQAGFTSSDLYNQPVFMSGLTPTSSGYGANQATLQTVGTNRLEGFFDDLTVGASTGDVLETVQNLTGDELYGDYLTDYEAQYQGGDSGSPLMMLAGGKLLLLGVAWAIGPDDIDPDPNNVVERPSSVATFTGSHASEILTLIPEPGVTCLALAAGVVLAARRRRVG